MKWLDLRVMGLASILLTAAQFATTPIPSPDVLDQENGFARIKFGSLDAQAPGLTPDFSGLGKRWRNTKLYHRLGDTTTLGGQAVTPAYWFRNHRFEGVTIEISLIKAAAISAFLKLKYGPSWSDATISETEYWLGARSYILYERAYPKSRGYELHIASLVMLNEQVLETAVRQQARVRLGWQPDSLGLPRQFPR